MRQSGRMEESRERFADLTLETFSTRLASSDPVPGGGSASAVAAALGASLVAMVANLSIGRPKYAAYADVLEEARELATTGRRRLLELADEDAQAYSAFMTARRLPQESEDSIATRDAAVAAAARRAAEVPLEIVRECGRLAEVVEAMAGRSNLNAASDLGVAAHLIEAAAQGAGANVIINLPEIPDQRFAGGLTAELSGELEAIQRFAVQTREMIGEGRLREPEEA